LANDGAHGVTRPTRQVCHLDHPRISGPGLNEKRIAFVCEIRNPHISIMNSTKQFFLGILVCLGTAAVLQAETTNQFADTKSKVSYAIGMMLGHNWQQQGLETDPDVVVRGIKDVQGGGATLMTPEEAQTVLRDFQQEFAAKQQQHQAEEATKAKGAGDAFLAANKGKPGVESLPDGLQYIVITNGTGAMPGVNDTVTVNYRGTLIDGKEFDSGTHEFRVGGVIRGWTEALQKMPVGSKWKLFIPSDLAYGERGNRGIPPNSALIFEVELLDAKAPTPPPVAAPLTSDIIKVPSAEEMKKGAKIEVIKTEDAARAQKGTP
jgi:FKBP-type peptidyl-prolyl cis-trans isomerase FklB